jgi:hypothetical protein
MMRRCSLSITSVNLLYRHSKIICLKEILKWELIIRDRRPGNKRGKGIRRDYSFAVHLKTDSANIFAASPFLRLTGYFDSKIGHKKGRAMTDPAGGIFWEIRFLTLPESPQPHQAQKPRAQQEGRGREGGGEAGGGSDLENHVLVIEISTAQQ